MPLVTTPFRAGPLRRRAGTSSPVLRPFVGRPAPGSGLSGPLRLGRWSPLQRSTWPEATLRGERPEATLGGERPEAGLGGERPEAALRGERPVAAHRAGLPDPPIRGASAVVVLADLRAVLTVTFVPLAEAVAVLDTTSSSWSLDLDSDSSDEDQYWAMTDALRVLRHGASAAEHAAVASPLRPLHLVAGRPAPGT